MVQFLPFEIHFLVCIHFLCINQERKNKNQNLCYKCRGKEEVGLADPRPFMLIYSENEHIMIDDIQCCSYIKTISLRLGGGKGMEWNGKKKKIKNILSFPLFTSLSRREWNRREWI